MTIEQWVAVLLVAIPAVAAMVGSVTAVVLGFLNRNKIDKLAVTVDGRLEQLLKVTGESQRAEGVVQGGVDSAAIEAMIHEAMSRALRSPAPVPGLAEAIERNLDTNDRLKAIELSLAAPPKPTTEETLAEIQATGTQTLDIVKDVHSDTTSLTHKEPAG